MCCLIITELPEAMLDRYWAAEYLYLMLRPELLDPATGVLQRASKKHMARGQQKRIL